MTEYVPDRGGVIWLDFEPTKGKEIAMHTRLVRHLDRSDFLDFKVWINCQLFI